MWKAADECLVSLLNKRVKFPLNRISEFNSHNLSRDKAKPNLTTLHMDIHRCRFVPYPPSAITALAFTHSLGSGSHNQPLRLAIGRANGDIEIWNPWRGDWIHETTFRGGKDRSVEGLAWIRDPDEKEKDNYVIHGRLRLFSTGYSNSITEWDLCTGLPLREGSAGSSEVWCLAAQPRWTAPKKGKIDVGVAEKEGEVRRQDLVAGCADGSLVLLSTVDGQLNFQRYIARASKKNARALSIAFQDRNTVVVGFADSAMRVYDIRNGFLIRTMTLSPGARGGPKETLIWAVECLKDGTIVSGDSNGEVIFWDAKNYGQLQRIKGHEADTLCLAASEDGQTVFSGGMDRRTVVYNLQAAEGQRRRWAMIAHRRFHQHDVKAMARFENSKMSLVVSGGLDTNPIITPLREFGKEYHRKLSYTPQVPPIASAGRLLVSWWNNEILIWRVNRPSQQASELSFPEAETSYKTLARLTVKGDENIASVSISPSGTSLAVATSAEVKLFKLLQREKRGVIKIRKMEVPHHFSVSGARLVLFSADSKWLLTISPDSTLGLTRLIMDAEMQQTPLLRTRVNLQRLHRHRTTQNSLNGSWGSYDTTITRAAFSHDSRLLAVSDLSGHIDTWVLEGHEDLTAPALDVAGRASPDSTSDSDSESDVNDDANTGEKTTTIIYGQHWARNPLGHMIPRLPSSPLILSFRPPSPSPSVTTSRYTSLPNGNSAIHSTPHNAQSHSHSFPGAGEYRLFILTASHEVCEFEVLRARLSDWSRRNAGFLPEEFQVQGERAVGCLWDVADRRERVWLYGSNWVAMFDLAQDFPRPKTVNAEINGLLSVEKNGDMRGKANTRKRKRNSLHETRGQLPTTGAGGRVRDDELGGGFASRKMRKLDAEGGIEEMDLEDPSRMGKRKAAFDSDDEDGSEEDEEQVLGGLRELRQAPEQAWKHRDEDEEMENVVIAANGDTVEGAQMLGNYTVSRRIIGEEGDGGEENPGKDNENMVGGSRGLRQASLEIDAGEQTGEFIHADGDTLDETHKLGNYTVTRPVVPFTNGVSKHPSTSKQAGFYITNRYRPILGLVPIIHDEDSKGQEENGDGQATPPALEVALIERPFWELDLPPRFHGNQEWEK